MLRNKKHIFILKICPNQNMNDTLGDGKRSNTIDLLVPENIMPRDEFKIICHVDLWNVDTEMKKILIGIDKNTYQISYRIDV